MNPLATREERLSSWLEAWLEARESGSTPDVSSFCTEEDLRAEFQDLVRQAEGLDFLADDVRERREESSPKSAARDPLLGRVIDAKLKVERLLGRGGMGAVYAARHVGLQRDVALKFLGELRFGRPESHARFEREARALARLRHASIVPVLDTGTFEGRPWLAMELLRGCDLAAWIRALPSATEVPAIGAARAAWIAASGLSERDTQDAERWRRPFFELVAALGADVARGLEAAHAAQVVHRDVKPSNLWLDAEGRACLADFGLARLGDEATLTREDAPLGTPAYMPPEQLGKSPEVLDGRADVYGLGASLYHVLTRRLPFEGGSAEVMTRLRYEDPPEPRALCPALPRDLEAIVLRAMEKRPGDRYASARELAEDLEAFVDRREVQARRMSWPRRWWRRALRRPARALSAGALMIAFLAAGWAFALSQREARSASERHVREVYAALPALVTLEHDPKSRWLKYLDPAAIGSAFDEILAFDPGDAIARWYRGNFRSQHGDIAGARADFDALRTGNQATPLLTALVERLTSTDESARWLLPAPADLPEAQSALDEFLAGYVALRHRSFHVALQHFDRAVERARAEGHERLWPIRDARAIAALGALNGPRALEDAYAVEGALGRPTARTRHVIGAALYLQGADEPAEAALRESITLHADGHAPHHNLGVLLARVGRRAEALEELSFALEKRPEVWNTRWEIARLHRDAGDFEAARAVLEGQAEDPTPGMMQKVRIALLNIEIEAWRVAREANDAAQAETCLQRALEHRAALDAEKRLGSVERRKFLVSTTRLDWLREAIDAEQAYERYLELWIDEEAFLATRSRAEYPFLRDPYLRENLARAAVALERFREAELFLRQALAAETCPLPVRGLLVELLQKREKWDAAFAELLNAPEQFRRDSRRESWIRTGWAELTPAQRTSVGPKLRDAGLADEALCQELGILPAPPPGRADR